MTTSTEPQQAEEADLDAIIKALSHPVRRQILCWLKQPEKYFADQQHSLEHGVCAGKLERCTGLSQSTTSAHLSVLQKAQLVTAQRVGQWIFFKRNERVIDQFVSQLGSLL